MPLTVAEFLTIVAREEAERAANPPAPAPDPYEAWGEEIDRYPIGRPLVRGCKGDVGAVEAGESNEDADRS